MPKPELTAQGSRFPERNSQEFSYSLRAPILLEHYPAIFPINTHFPTPLRPRGRKARGWNRSRKQWANPHSNLFIVVVSAWPESEGVCATTCLWQGTTTLWSPFFPSVFTWNPGIKHRSSGLHGEHVYTPSISLTVDLKVFIYVCVCVSPPLSLGPSGLERLISTLFYKWQRGNQYSAPCLLVTYPQVQATTQWKYAGVKNYTSAVYAANFPRH